NHVMKRWNPPPSASKSRRIVRMGVHDRPHIAPRPENVAMEAPLTRRPPPPEPMTIEAHRRHIRCLQLLIHSARRTDKKPVLMTNTDVPRGPVSQPAPRQLPARRHQRRPQVLISTHRPPSSTFCNRPTCSASMSSAALAQRANPPGSDK